LGEKSGTMADSIADAGTVGLPVAIFEIVAVAERPGREICAVEGEEHSLSLLAHLNSTCGPNSPWPTPNPAESATWSADAATSTVMAPGPRAAPERPLRPPAPPRS